MSQKQTVRIKVNGKERTAEVEPRRTLADLLREDLNLTGTHLGCEHGVCGSCTVVCNGQAIRSCLMFAIQADGAEVLTVEGLSEGERLHPIQEAFAEQHGPSACAMARRLNRTGASRSTTSFELGPTTSFSM